LSPPFQVTFPSIAKGRTTTGGVAPPDKLDGLPSSHLFFGQPPSRYFFFPSHPRWSQTFNGGPLHGGSLKSRHVSYDPRHLRTTGSFSQPSSFSPFGADPFSVRSRLARIRGEVARAAVLSPLDFSPAPLIPLRPREKFAPWRGELPRNPGGWYDMIVSFHRFSFFVATF